MTARPADETMKIISIKVSALLKGIPSVRSIANSTNSKRAIAIPERQRALDIASTVWNETNATDN